MYPLVNPVDYQRTQQILTAIETQDILTLIDVHLSITNQRAKDLTTLFPNITALRWVLDLNLISEFDIQSIDDHVANQWRIIFTICHYNVFGDTYHIEIKIMAPVVIITVWNKV